MDAGGAETYLMKTYRKLDREKYQMDFAVSVEGKGYYDDEILSLGGQLHFVPPKSKNPIKSFAAIARLVRREGYKYVLRTSQQSLAALDLLAARLGGAKVLVYRSSNAGTTLGGKGRLLQRLFAFMPRLFANVKVAPSTEAVEYVFGKGCVKSGKAQLLRNAIDLDHYRFDAEGRERVKAELGITGKTVIGHVGRFNAQKNHKFLLSIFAEIKKRQPDSVLLLVGKGELQQDVRQQAQHLGIDDSVIFAGVRSDIPQVMSAMDVFVFPSFFEGMPNTVIEAQATGLPCVIADTITREANITGLVQYLSLDTPPEQWAEQALAAVTCSRKDTISDFINNQYDIQSVADQFVRLCFGG
jgi:glycosyltransferase involved in cell wall biosynthesis